VSDPNQLPPQSPVYELSDRYVEQWARLDPVGATSRGVLGYETEMTDYSPEGCEGRAELTRRVLAEVSSLLESGEPEDRDRIAGRVLQDRLSAELAAYEAGERLRDLRVIGSPVGGVRSVFDLMANESADDWEVIATRMEKVPQALESFTDTLRSGMSVKVMAARRQALACAEQAEAFSASGAFSSSGAGGKSPFFISYVAQAPRNLEPVLARRLDAAARSATSAYAQLAAFLRYEYAPRAPEVDAVGAERYQLAARYWLGMDIDAVEAYYWGWEELDRVEAEMARVASQIVPGGSIAEAISALESDPAKVIEGEDRLRAWLQDLMDTTVEELDGRHFDIPPPIRKVEAMIAPPGGAAAMYYTGPSEDLSRPGRTWYPTLGKTRFPIWGEVSIAYHEGVPGHHLQIGQVRYLADRLSRFQRIISIGGHAEGWALYAERLMAELGYLSKPDFLLGQLRAQAMRSVRVILDIGLHHQLAIPAGRQFHPGEIWNAELANQFAVDHSYFPPDFMASEVVRYLGWPAQAICYKVGERVWLDIREELRRRLGAAFDLKRFHADALELGPMGLAALREELTGTRAA